MKGQQTSALYVRTMSENFEDEKIVLVLEVSN